MEREADAEDQHKDRDRENFEHVLDEINADLTEDQDFLRKNHAADHIGSGNQDADAGLDRNRKKIPGDAADENVEKVSLVPIEIQPRLEQKIKYRRHDQGIDKTPEQPQDSALVAQLEPSQNEFPDQIAIPALKSGHRR